MRQVLVEGSRGITHSYAVVNMYQLLALQGLPGIALAHADLPFAQPHMNLAQHGAGWPADRAAALDRLPAPRPGQRFDCAYRIGYPYAPSAAAAARRLVFMTAEFGLTPQHFAGGHADIAAFCRGDDALVVPSQWARAKLVEFGFPAPRVTVVPHGVDEAVFHPASAPERAALRRQLGLGDDDFVFLNLGAMTWNKGIDLLLQAFAALRREHPRARLLLKDDRGLYGIGALERLREHVAALPAGADIAALAESIKIVSGNLTLAQMRLLYGAADIYVSPYRAEGFNLPVIEAIACGLPALVTAGGATDDFCDARVAAFIASRPVANAARGVPGAGRHLEPDAAALRRLMDEAINGRLPGAEGFRAGRLELLRRFSWGACARRLAELF